MKLDAVIFADESCSSDDFMRLVQWVVESSSHDEPIIHSIVCLSFDDRSAALWSAIAASPLMAGVRCRGARYLVSEVEAALDFGSSEWVMLTSLANVDLRATGGVFRGVESGGGLLDVPLDRATGAGATAVVARQLLQRPYREVESSSGATAVVEIFSRSCPHLLSEKTPMTKIWVVERERQGPQEQLLAQDSSVGSGYPRHLEVDPILSIVVPTLDVTSPHCRELLTSLRRWTSVPYQVVLVDNANAPQGFTKPVNTALRGVRTPYLAVVNDDVVVRDSWWEPLQEALDGGEWVVFPETEEYTRMDFSAWCFAMSYESFQKLSYSDDCFFNPSFTIWFQDSDLYLRMAELGRAPRCVPKSRISHLMSASVGSSDSELSPWVRATTADDRERFVHEWGDRGLRKIGFRDPFAESITG
jgi:hypothetical protein